MNKHFTQYMDDLRASAIKRLEELEDDLTPQAEGDLKIALEELKIYQAEIEIQNEELIEQQKFLEREKSRYMTLFEFSPVGFVVLDQNGIIRHLNATFSEWFSGGSSKLIGRALAKFIHHEDRNAFISRFEAFLKKPNGKLFNVRLIIDDEIVNVSLAGKEIHNFDFETTVTTGLMVSVSKV